MSGCTTFKTTPMCGLLTRASGVLCALPLLVSACGHSATEATDGNLPPADTAYTVVDLGTLGSDPESEAHAINTSTQIVGVSKAAGGPYSPRWTAILWSAGVMSTLRTGVESGDYHVEALGLNDQGDVVGGMSASSEGAFLWRQGVTTVLGWGAATDINNAGQVVGVSRDSSGTPIAVLWQNGLMLTLGVAAPGEGIEATAINNAGEVVLNEGARSVVWSQGRITDLGTLGGDTTQGSAINSAGDVVGASTLSSGDTHAFVWRTGVMTDLKTLGGCCSWARGINNVGQIVGASVTASGETHAVLWQNGEARDLGTLGGGTIGGNPFPPYSAANAINDAGEIVGVTSIPPLGNWHAVLWRPPR